MSIICARSLWGTRKCSSAIKNYVHMTKVEHDEKVTDIVVVIVVVIGILGTVAHIHIKRYIQYIKVVFLFQYTYITGILCQQLLSICPLLKG